MTSEEIKQAKRKWWNQKQKAKQRGIAWDFPFEDWLQFWMDSGHWHQRGIKSKDSYVMSRLGDSGPYRRDNVEIKTNAENVKEGSLSKPKQQLRMSCVKCLTEVSVNNRFRHWDYCQKESTPKGALDAYPIKN